MSKQDEAAGQETTRLLQFPERPRPTAIVQLWEQAGQPDFETLRSSLIAEGYQVVRWDSRPNQVYLPHAHIYSELLWLVAGSLVVILSEQERILALEPGDRVELPAGTQHAVQAGVDGALYLLATR
jgi:quercetin dioxygenase-like cupin family protein